GGGGGSGSLDRIIAPDLSSSVTCINGGVIQSVGTVNFNENSLNRVTEINAGTTQPFTIIKDNSEIKMDTNLFEIDVASNIRFAAEAGQSVVLSPAMTAGLVVQDTSAFIGVSGIKFLADTTQTLIQSGTDFVTLSGGVTTLTCAGATSATFNNGGITSQHLLLYDQAGAGSHNPFFISGNGFTYMYIENRALADGAAPYILMGVGTNNFVMQRANRSGGFPLPSIPGGIVIGPTSFVGIYRA